MAIKSSVILLLEAEFIDCIVIYGEYPISGLDLPVFWGRRRPADFVDEYSRDFQICLLEDKWRS